MRMPRLGWSSTSLAAREGRAATLNEAWGRKAGAKGRLHQATAAAASSVPL